jgi:hypothetical protein
LLQGNDIPRVSFNISGQFGHPEFLPRLRENRILTILVSMPETAVYEDCYFVPREDDVRATREIPAFQ